jgi:hypothetical protein
MKDEIVRLPVSTWRRIAIAVCYDAVKRAVRGDQTAIDWLSDQTEVPGSFQFWADVSLIPREQWLSEYDDLRKRHSRTICNKRNSTRTKNASASTPT